MMHRFVAMIGPGRSLGSNPSLRDRLASRLADWETVLTTASIVLWVHREPPSRLGGVRNAHNSAIVGRQFDGGWGAYVAIKELDLDDGVEVFRDPSGRIPCWHVRIGDVWLVFSHYLDVVEFRASPWAINWDFIAFHLINDTVHGSETGLAGVTEVLPGQVVRFSSSGSDQALRWRPSLLANDQHRSLADARSEIRASAELAVSSWAPLYGRVALDLSGGLDSTILLGLLRAHAPETEVVGINYITPHPESDERSFAREAAAFHNVPLFEVEMASDFQGEELPFAGRLLRPAARLFTSLYDDITSRKYREVGAEAFLTGTGGDHLFYDHLPIGAASDFRRDHGLVGLMEQMVRSAQLSKTTVWKALREVWTDYAGPRPSIAAALHKERPFISAATRADVQWDRFAHPWLRDGFLELGPAKRAQILMLDELQRHYTRLGRADVAEELHPFVSQPLIEATLRTPTYWFARNGLQRGLARQIFADLLPPSIRDRRSKSSNTSLWLEVLGRDLKRYRGLLLEGELTRRGLVDRAALERTLREMEVVGVRRMHISIISCLATEVWIQQQREVLPPYRSVA